MMMTRPADHRIMNFGRLLLLSTGRTSRSIRRRFEKKQPTSSSSSSPRPRRAFFCGRRAGHARAHALFCERENVEKVRTFIKCAYEHTHKQKRKKVSETLKCTCFFLRGGMGVGVSKVFFCLFFCVFVGVGEKVVTYKHTQQKHTCLTNFNLCTNCTHTHIIAFDFL